MRRIGLIGAGKIGGPVIEAVLGDLAGDCEIAAVLTASPRDLPGVLVTCDPLSFFDSEPDVIIEAAGAEALRTHGERAIMTADLWVTSGVALADREFRERLIDRANSHQNQLRVLSGAIAGLDAVVGAAVDPDMELSLSICIAPGAGERTVVFDGTVAEAAGRFPEDVNVAVAASLAGHGPDRTAIEVIEPAKGEPRELRLTVTSSYGSFETLSVPRVVPNESIHTVSANIIAALRSNRQALRIG